MQILSGQIQLVLYTFTALPLYTLCRAIIIWRKEKRINLFTLLPLISAGLALVIGSGLAAFQLLPLAELVPTIRRGEGDVDLYNSPLALLRIFIPDLLGTNIDGLTMLGYRFEFYLYLGVLPLFFALAALFSERTWLARCLVGMGVFFLLPIFNVPPFFQLFYHLYPTFSTLGCVRAMFIIVFLWAAAAGIGADWLLANRPERILKMLTRVGLAIGSITLVYLVSLAFLAKYQARHFWNLPALPNFQPSSLYHFSTLIFFLVLLVAIFVLLWTWTTRRISPRLFVILSIGLIVFDLFLTHIDFAPVLPKHLLYPVTPSLNFLQQKVAKEDQPFRISGVGRILWPNTSGAFSLPVIQVYDSFLPRRYFEYAEASGIRAPSNLRVVTYQAKASRLVDALNVKYLYTPRDLLAAGDGVSLLSEVEAPQIVSDYGEAGQIFEWSINNWTQEVIVAPAPSTFHYQGVLPGRLRLETAIAIDSQFWEADGVLFEVYVTKPGQQPNDPIFSRAIHPRENPDDRLWIPVQIDLSEFARQPIILSLVTKPENSPGTRGGWADPLLVDADRWNLLYYGPNSIYQNRLALPRAWVVHRITEVPPGDIEVVKTHLAEPDFDPAVEAIVEGALPELSQSTASSETSAIEMINIINYHPSRVEILAKIDSPGLLVLSDLFYPGWQVYVDNQPQTLLAANLVMRSVYLEAGEHTVTFSYEPPLFRWGVYISVGVALVVLIVLPGSWFFSLARSCYKTP